MKATVKLATRKVMITDQIEGCACTINHHLLIKVLNSGDGGLPLISMSMPRARHVDSMILKQHWMVGSWLHSSKSKW